MDFIAALRDHTGRIVKDFVAGGPRCVGSRATVLALTALGILATGGAGSIAALLSGFGINIGASALFDFLHKLSDTGPSGPTLEDALSAVQALGEREQAALQQVADRVDVVPMLFGEALAQQRRDLLADLGGLLVTWSSTLPFTRIEAMLEHIGEQIAGISLVQADQLELKEHLAALGDGLRSELDGRLCPLTAEVQALCGRVDALSAQLASFVPPSTAPALAAPRHGRRRAPAIGGALADKITAALWDEIRRETDSLLS